MRRFRRIFAIFLVFWGKRNIGEIIDDGEHLRGYPFISVIKGLLPKLDIEVFNEKSRERAVCHKRLRYVIGKKGDSRVFLDKLTDDICAACFENGLDLFGILGIKCERRYRFSKP